MDNKHLLHVYTGEGKGKTTAAMGLAFRMLGHGHKVFIAQFMKQPNSGELKAFAQFPNAMVWQGEPMQGFIYQMDEKALRKAKEAQTAMLDSIADAIQAFQPELTVLDELAVAIAYLMVPKDEAFALIDKALKLGEVVVTGRSASPELMEKANYVSRIEAVKHPYEDGIQARKGIEW